MLFGYVEGRAVGLLLEFLGVGALGGHHLFLALGFDLRVDLFDHLFPVGVDMKLE